MMFKSPKHILVTRPTHQAENLCQLLLEHNVQAVRLPCIHIVRTQNTDKINQLLAKQADFDWLIFVSANAVTMHQSFLVDGRMPPTKKTRFAAVGAATAQAMREHGLPVDLVPLQGYSSEALLASTELQQITGQSFLIVSGEGGRDELAKILQLRGAKIEYLMVYQREVACTDPTQTQALLQSKQLDGITITSGEIVRNLLLIIEKKYHPLLFALPTIVISERIKQIAVDMGFKKITVAACPSDTAILTAVIESLQGN